VTDGCKFFVKRNLNIEAKIEANMISGSWV